MIADLKPYPDYKDSGVPWLGTVPAHWDILPNRALFTEVKDRGHEAEDMLSVTITRGIIRQSALLADTSKKDSSNEDRSKYKLVQPGDIAYNKMRAWQGALGASPFRGIVSPAYIVMRPRPVALSKYFHFLLRTPTFTKEAERWSYGITSDQWSLRSEHFKMIYCCLPDAGEQSQIVRVLEFFIKKIGQVIRFKQKELSLLGQCRQALLDRIVLGPVPRELPRDDMQRVVQRKIRDGGELVSVRHLMQMGWLEIQDGNHGELHPKADDYVDDGIPFIMANSVQPGGLDLKGCAKLTETQARSLRIGFARAGDVLLTHKATIGRVGMVPGNLDVPFVMLTPQVTYYRCLRKNLRAHYLFYYMQTSQFQEQLARLSLNQSTRNYIGLLEQKNLVVPLLGGKLQEQLALKAQEAVGPLDAVQLKVINQIEAMQNYATRLITDLVTGKLDVRQIAISLPDIDEYERQTEVGPEEIEDELAEEAI